MPDAIDCACTLFEGDYHHGVAALANSLYRHGFRGTLYAGYKGSLPPWALVDSYGRFAAAPGLTLEFIRLETPWHLANYKAQFMLEIIDGPATHAQHIAYFDPDIVITCRWEFFLEWYEVGVCVVQEVTNGGMPSTHPLRAAWARTLRTNGEEVFNNIERYFNSGFLALRREHRAFLQLWQKVLVAVLKDKSEIADKFMQGDRSYPFYGLDQDCLNAALMASRCPISAIGPEGMGFFPGGFTMQHAVGTPKPWRFSLVQSLLSANPPRSAIKEFSKHVDGPIQSMTSWRRARLKTELRIASLVGRFYSRS